MVRVSLHRPVNALVYKVMRQPEHQACNIPHRRDNLALQIG